jgi:general secretion pathway protein G
MHRRPTTGFTLFELLIVISILLALGAVVTVSFISVGDQAEIDIQRAQFDQFDAALKRFRMDMKRYPSEDEGIVVLWNSENLDDEADAAGWRGPYLEDALTIDRWNNELLYRFPGEIVHESKYDLVSVGPDGEEGTDDDVTNHDRRKNEDGEIEVDDSFPSDSSGTATG